VQNLFATLRINFVSPLGTNRDASNTKLLPGRRDDRSGKVWGVMLREFGIAGLALAAGIATACAQDMKSPRISAIQVG
jgi:hypothetical protein